MKAQVAIEYLAIVSFALLVLIPYALYLQSVSRNLNEDNSLTIASNSVQKIGQTADWIFSQGEPAKITILIQIPSNVEEITFNGKIMNWKIRTSAGLSDVYYISAANLTGSLPTSPGYYNILIKAIEGGVNISVSPS
ncbi:MAG: hypothetical protein QXL86_03975 [Candidatus Aenigmatarchaeota archaeon]